MRTALPTAINTISEAKTFLQELRKNGEAYHPEDDATECFDTDSEHNLAWCRQVNKLMSDIYALEGNIDHLNMAFDPCAYLLELDGHVMETEQPTYTYFLKDADGEVIDQTQIDEQDDALALEIFTENDTKALPIGYTLEYEICAEVE